MELFSRYSGLLTGLSGARRRVGFHKFHAEGLYRGEMLTHRVNYNGHIHMAKNFMCMVNALLAPNSLRCPTPRLTSPTRRFGFRSRPFPKRKRSMCAGWCARFIRITGPDYHRIVLVNPNSSELLPQRRWERDNFSQLASMVVHEWDDVLVLITGSPGEREEALQMQEKVGHPRFRSFAGMHKLMAITALYNISTVLVTNDSGPGHFSAITPIRSIVLVWTGNAKTLWQPGKHGGNLGCSGLLALRHGGEPEEFSLQRQCLHEDDHAGAGVGVSSRCYEWNGS